jgi:hypothetical protein
VIPASVKFTGLTVDPLDIIDRRREGPIPMEWTRHQFMVEGYNDPTYALTGFINANLGGRWSINVANTTEGTIVVLGFERGNDAIMFRMLDGETEWKAFESARIT